MYFSTGSSGLMRPSSISIIAATPSTGLVEETMWNIASLRMGVPVVFIEQTVGLHVDHLVASSDADDGSLNATSIYVLLDNIIDLRQSFGRHADLFRPAVG